MESLIIQAMEQFGYVGILLLIALENIFPPIPSEVILTFGGFMTTYAKLNVWGVILSATLGALVGAVILYKFGSIFTPEKLENWLDGKWGKRLHLKKQDVNKAFQWFHKRGKTTVLICRCIPVLRSLISIPAGMSKMNMGIFLILTTIGSLVWNIILVYLGVAAGASWEKIVEFMDTFSTVVGFGLIGIVFVGILLFVKQRFLKKKEVVISNK